MIKISDKAKCCGCEACVQVCPKQCISFNQDAEGFYYPSVDETICINCGKCEKVCPVINQEESRMPQTVIATTNPDAETRRASSSGGIFTLLAEKIIDKGGVVFGVKFNEQWLPVIDVVETKEALKAFQGSKYVQARVGNSYSICKEYLKEGRQVLFSGTPCQISGLHHFLQKPYTNLITIDIICHGTPSPMVWKRYLDEVIEAANKAFSNFWYRIRLKGWKNYQFCIEPSEDGIEMFSQSRRNGYMRVFQNSLTLRPSCFECPAKCGSSKSDITLGDFWGIQKVLPSIDDNTGTSMVVINTQKGFELFDSLGTKQEQFVYDDIKEYNRAYYRSALSNPQRKDFFDAIINSKDINKILLKYTPLNKEEKIIAFKQTIKKLLKAITKCSVNTQLKYNVDGLTKQNYTISNISFRDKKEGWKSYFMKITLKNQ